jgi:UDPglucose 6-dehydrogenase
MKICVVGLWHLGTVVAACLADYGYSVTAIDDDIQVVAALKEGKAPISESGLNDLLLSGLSNGNLRFTNEFKQASTCDIVWITADTPVDANDEADLDFVRAKIDAVLPHVATNACLIISSQVAIGFTGEIAALCRSKFSDKQLSFVYSPENLRLGKAIKCFRNPDRVILGSDTEAGIQRAKEVFKPWTDNFVCMSFASAEMTKHALNAFLGLSITFINEIATLCELVGADAHDVACGLKSEARIGAKAYLNPGGAFAGGTLARDVSVLVNKSEYLHQSTPLLKSIRPSNEAHKQWVEKRLKRKIRNLDGQVIAVLGLAYKPGTDTLRRSAAVELCTWLSAQGSVVKAHDPAVSELPDALTAIIMLQDSVEKALTGANAVIIASECPEFRQISAEQLVSATKEAIVFDASGYLHSRLGNDRRIDYISLGKP